MSLHIGDTPDFAIETSRGVADGHSVEIANWKTGYPEWVESINGSC